MLLKLSIKCELEKAQLCVTKTVTAFPAALSTVYVGLKWVIIPFIFIQNHSCASFCIISFNALTAVLSSFARNVKLNHLNLCTR